MLDIFISTADIQNQISYNKLSNFLMMKVTRVLVLFPLIVIG